MVGISRRRAASDALSISADICSSFAHTKLTAEDLDLVLDLRGDREMVGGDEDVPAVLQRHEEGERLLQAVDDAGMGFPRRPLHS